MPPSLLRRPTLLLVVAVLSLLSDEGLPPYYRPPAFACVSAREGLIPNGANGHEKLVGSNGPFPGSDDVLLR